MRTLFFFLFLSCTLLSFAQSDASEKSIALTLGLSNTEWSNNFIIIERLAGDLDYTYWLQEEQRTGLSISLDQKRSNGWQHSWGIVQANYATHDNAIIVENININISEPLGGQRSRYAVLHLRWAYGTIIHPLSSDKFRVVAQVGLDPIIQHIRVTPRTSAGFPLLYTRLGFSANLISRLEFKLAKRLWLAMHATASIQQTAWEKSVVENPVLTDDQKMVARVNSQFNLFPQQVMLGVSYDL